MSTLLREFLEAWLDWIEHGACEAQPFDRGHGLCANFDHWLDEHGADWETVETEIDDLLWLFVSEGLGGCYPFDSQAEFISAHERREQHLNPRRIAWVRSKVGQVEEV
jgi:hypothetical protein